MNCIISDDSDSVVFLNTLIEISNYGANTNASTNNSNQVINIPTELNKVCVLRHLFQSQKKLQASDGYAGPEKYTFSTILKQLGLVQSDFV